MWKTLKSRWLKPLIQKQKRDMIGFGSQGKIPAVLEFIAARAADMKM